MAIALTTGTMAFAAANLGGADAAAESISAVDGPAVASAEQATRDVVDERLRGHLRRLR